MSDPYKAGDKSKAICPFCEMLCTTTFKVWPSNMPPAREVFLVGVCDNCGKIVSIPQQSVQSFNERDSESNSQYVVLVGNLSDGFRAYGPYESFDEAAAAHTDSGSWVMTMIRPRHETANQYGEATQEP